MVPLAQAPGFLAGLATGRRQTLQAAFTFPDHTPPWYTSCDHRSPQDRAGDAETVAVVTDSLLRHADHVVIHLTATVN